MRYRWLRRKVGVARAYETTRTVCGTMQACWYCRYSIITTSVVTLLVASWIKMGPTGFTLRAVFDLLQFVLVLATFYRVWAGSTRQQYDYPYYVPRGSDSDDDSSSSSSSDSSSNGSDGEAPLS